MKNILVCIDCQVDFISGSLRNEEAIKKVPNIVKKIHGFNGDAIYVTLDTHQENYLETKEGKKLPVVHCVENTEGWQLEPNVKAALVDAELKGIPVYYINKPTFGTEELPFSIHTLTNPNNEEMEIEYVGYCTDICVVSNVLICKAAFYEYANIIVDASCCAGVTPESHKAALITMKMCQINIINE